MAFWSIPSSVWKLLQPSALCVCCLRFRVAPGRPSAQDRGCVGCPHGAPQPHWSGTQPAPHLPPALCSRSGLHGLGFRRCGPEERRPTGWVRVSAQGLSPDGREPLGALPPNPERSGPSVPFTPVTPRLKVGWASPGAPLPLPCCPSGSAPKATPLGPSWGRPQFIHGTFHSCQK